MYFALCLCWCKREGACLRLICKELCAVHNTSNVLCLLCRSVLGETAQGGKEYFEDTPDNPYNGSLIVSQQPAVLEDFSTGLPSLLACASFPGASCDSNITG